MSVFFDNYEESVAQAMVNAAIVYDQTLSVESAVAEQKKLGDTMIALLQDEMYIGQCDNKLQQSVQQYNKRIAAGLALKADYDNGKFANNVDDYNVASQQLETDITLMAQAALEESAFLNDARAANYNALRTAEDVAFELAKLSNLFESEEQLAQVTIDRTEGRAHYNVTPATDIVDASTKYAQAMTVLNALAIAKAAAHATQSLQVLLLNCDTSPLAQKYINAVVL